MFYLLVNAKLLNIDQKKVVGFLVSFLWFFGISFFGVRRMEETVFNLEIFIFNSHMQYLKI